MASMANFVGLCARGEFEEALQLGVDPKEAVDRDGWTALHWAALKGDIKNVRILALTHSCDPRSSTTRAVEKDGQYFSPRTTPLHVACW